MYLLKTFVRTWSCRYRNSIDNTCSLTLELFSDSSYKIRGLGNLI